MPESPIDKLRNDSLAASITEVLRTVFDPEIPVNIYDLGLVYDIAVDGDSVHLKMTLTSPNCPVAGALVSQVESRIRAIDGVSEARVELVWDPPWTPARMSEAARLELNMEGDDPPRKRETMFNIGRR